MTRLKGAAATSLRTKEFSAIIPAVIAFVIFSQACLCLAQSGMPAAALTPSSSTTPASMPTTTSITKPADDLIQLTFPPNTEVKVLIDYVSRRLGINILYDEAIGAKRITISSPGKVPKDSLLGLLQSVLKMANLTLIDGDQPGWKKIVPAQNLLSTTSDLKTDTHNLLAGADGDIAITQVFTINNSAIATVEQVVKPFLSQPGGNSFSLADRNLLIVTDYAGNLRRIASLIDLIDSPSAKTTFRFVPVKNLDASELAKQVAALLADKDRVGSVKSSTKITLTTEPRSNQVIVIAAEGADQEAIELLEKLDVPTTAVTRTYRLKNISPQRIDKLAQDYIGSEPFKKAYKSTVDAESGVLIVSAPPNVHEYVASLVRDLDVAGDPSTSHVRFYKLMNTTASMVLATIRSLESGDKSMAAVDMSAAAGEPVGNAGNGGDNNRDENKFTGPNNPPGPPGQESPTPPAYHEAASAPSSQPSGNAVAAPTAIKTKEATITADTNTNTIIIIAPPAVQNTYKQLIAILDKRRPQVMLEVTLVTLDTSNSFSLGVDLAHMAKFGGENSYLVFNSFGLSTVAPGTGSLAIIPGAGFNGVLLAPDVANAVIKALASDAHAKVLSAPKVMVNDNATASLSSVSEAPYTSINASQTVSTTSFAGYASAGTTLTLTPHISEGDHLQVQYSVTLNSFTGESSGGIPPPRQTNTINSDVTVPDGNAVVVGGLTRKDSSETVAKVPLLGDVPIVKYAFSSRTIKDSQSTLFVFIRPIILRDDNFEDLKYLSDKDLALADLSPNLPASKPLIMK